MRFTGGSNWLLFEQRACLVDVLIDCCEFQSRQACFVRSSPQRNSAAICRFWAHAQIRLGAFRTDGMHVASLVLCRTEVNRNVCRSQERVLLTAGGDWLQSGQDGGQIKSARASEVAGAGCFKTSNSS